MQKKRNISSPKVGMNRDTHSSLLKPSEYTLAINANTENETGEKLNITNEPSNYLAVVFPAGFKVIGFKYNLPSNKTYFWLTNPETKKSSVGYIDSIEISQENVDQYNQCTECRGFTELGTPLENVEQTPFNSYVTLFDDINCEETLEFDLNYPIKNIEIKNEKGQVTAYWDDNKNPSRFAVLSDPSYLFSQTIPCEEEEQLPATCLFVDRLLHFPNYTPMNIQAEGIQTGGNLKLGTYEFWGTYCDIKGNNIVNYSTPTQPISIFDENNSLLEQTELDSFTNYSIKLTVNNLDTTFAYYKIVCVERTNINNTQSAFVAGIYPTTDNTVLYSSSGTSNDDEYLQNGNASIRRRIDFNELYQVRPTYKSAKGTTSSGNILWKWGLKEKETLNLQPVVNLFGSLLKWQTSVAKESLFKSPIACSKYKGNMRNEVQPFALRFHDLDGNYTPIFPIIARPSIDDEKEDLVDTNYESLSQTTPNCSHEGRTKRWQILNTAKSLSTFGDLDWNCAADIEIITTPPEPLQKTCVVENVYTITTNTATIENPGEYVDLVTFIEENPNIEIENVSQYINADYPDDTCPPNFTSCDTPVLIDNYNEVVNVETEVTELVIGQKYVIYNLVAGDDFSNVGYEEEGRIFITTGITPKVWTNSTEVFLKKEVIIDSTEKLITTYKRSVPPSYCPAYTEIDSTTGNPFEDEEFEDDFMPCNGDDVYFRNIGNITNEDCQYPVALENNNTTTSSGQAYYHNYSASTNIGELKLFHETHIDSRDAHFTEKLHKGALWFSVEKLGRDKLIFEITKNTRCTQGDGITKLADDIGNKLRYNVYSDCSVAAPLIGEIFNAEEGNIVSIDCSTLGETFYIAIDAPIVAQDIAETCPATNIRTVYKVVPPCGCFTPYTRDVTYTSITIEWSNIVINKYSKYQANCTYQFPKLNDCDPVPYENGEFAYWESTETYPDNKELYDSSELIIRTGDLATLTQTDKERFLEFYRESIEGDTIQLKDANFRCQAIRHPKMPDNTLTPFMSTQVSKAFAESLIFPLGVSLDENVIKTMLQIAVNNNLITQKQADNIAGYEILRGDNTIHKSIIANGLGYDLYKYRRDKQDYYYANYPFNDLGKDVLHYTDSTRSEFVEHPFEGQGNNKFTIISPDLFLNTPTLSTEMVMSGYQLGNSRGSFPEVKDHPKWTILGKKGRRTADDLATAEVVLDVALSVSELTKEQWATFGVGSTGANFGSYISLGIYAVAKGFSAFMQRGKYRYEWLKAFRDLGSQYNFASYGVAEGFHNNFLPNTEESEYIRGLPLAKYVKDGEYKYVDESTTKTVNLNNHLREHSVFVSSGEYNFNYDPIYSEYDNSTENPSQASRTIASQNNCKPNEEYTKNVGSPYFTLKNYIPDQFGTIDSIKWLTTNYSFKLQDEGASCTTIFGGTVSISRFTWKKKIPIFKATAMGLPNKLAVEYLPYKNIAEPRFYCDYEVDGEQKSLGVPFPDIDSRYTFDCQTPSSNFYLRPNSKFYLYYYGITNFLVESEINCNFRYGKREPKNQFYPQVGDLKDWTQEVNVPIKEPNTFYYNNVYSLPVSNSPYSFLDSTYSKLLWELRGNQENAVIYSEPDNSQNEIFDSWRVFKPLNWNEFDKKYGKLIGLKDLESSQLLAQFENGMLVLGAVDSLADRITPQNRALGTAGIFSTRPTEFKRTDLGFAGTQNTEIVSTPYGHLWADALRGKVFMLDQNAKGLEIISEMLGNQPTGMKNWFKENLPFKILKDFPSADIDNKYKGLGLNIWYDSRFDRVFITKKDYISKGEECLKYEDTIGFYKDCEETVISCPTGYTYNEDTEMCERSFETENLCPEGYEYDEELQTCTLIEVVNAECPVIDENTQINIWFDNSGSMNSTLAPLQTMASTILKPCLLPFYNNDSALYDSMVSVQNFTPIVNDNSNPNNERYIRLLSSVSTNPIVTKTINIAFQDESDAYGVGLNVDNFNGVVTTQASEDITLLRSTLLTEAPNSLFGIIFKVDTTLPGVPLVTNGFKQFVAVLHSGANPFSGTNGLSDKPEIIHVLDVIPASTPTYYTNLIITALNSIGFPLQPCNP